MDQRSLTWAPAFGILDGPDGRAGLAALRFARFGGLAARVCAGFSRESLFDIVDWLVWLFAFDDRYCEEAAAQAGPAAFTATLVGFLSVFDAPAAARSTPFHRALADIWQRTLAKATALQAQRRRLQHLRAGERFRNFDEVEHLTQRRKGAETQRGS